MSCFPLLPRFALLATICLLATAPVVAEPSPGEITVDTRAELVQAVESAEPGTKVLISPGTFQGGLTFRDHRGAAGNPIVIAARNPADPPVFKGGRSGLHLSRPSFVELHDLVFIEATGNGLNIDDGGEGDRVDEVAGLQPLELAADPPVPMVYRSAPGGGRHG